MQYPWHPLIGKTFDIQIHFSRAHTEAYRCRPSGQSGTIRQDIPAWMFNSALCSSMRLSEQPYCSLDSLKQLLLLLGEASSSECIIGQNQNAFNKKGDANAESQPATQNSRHASVPSPRSSSNNMEKSFQPAVITTDETNEQDANGIPKSSGRRSR